MKVRPIRVEGAVAFVTLTQGFVAAIDAADLPLAEGFNWYALAQRHGVYAVRTEQAGGKQRMVLMHRALLAAPAEMHVDHISGDGLDNRQANLRLATRAQNSQNQGLSRLNTSGLKGVSWCKRDGGWSATIGAGGKSQYLGRHDTAELAHAAYCEASKRLHGEFGRTT